MTPNLLIRLARLEAAQAAPVALETSFSRRFGCFVSCSPSTSGIFNPVRMWLRVRPERWAIGPRPRCTLP